MGGGERARAGLLALEQLEYDAVELARLALDAISRNEAMEDAAEIAARHLTSDHRQEIEAVASTILVLAEPMIGSLFDRFESNHPTLLLRASSVAPDLVQAAIEKARNAFPGEWTEAQFQESVRTRLRANPSIGSKLEEHPHAGGGITDLSLNRVRLELKVDPKDVSLDEAMESYGQQTAQYAVQWAVTGEARCLQSSAPRRRGVHPLLCRTTSRRG